jgi:aerobic C4-dicarboxylate transport protein
MSEARSLTNFIGNGVAAIVVARWEKELDTVRLTAELTGHRSTPAEPPGEGSRQFADL